MERTGKAEITQGEFLLRALKRGKLLIGFKSPAGGTLISVVAVPRPLRVLGTKQKTKKRGKNDRGLHIFMLR